MKIALCSYSPREKETSTLMQIGEVIRFDRGAFVAYALRNRTKFDVIIVMDDDARGMNDCMTIRENDSEVPIIWVSNQEAFFAQSERLNVDKFLIKPTTTAGLKEAVVSVLKNKLECRDEENQNIGYDRDCMCNGDVAGVCK